jgi:hypothetical protein
MQRSHRCSREHLPDWMKFGQGHHRPDVEMEFCGARDLGVSRALNPTLQTFGQWLTANKGSIPRSSAST